MISKRRKWLVEIERLAAQWYTFGGPDPDYWGSRGYQWGAGGNEPWPAAPLSDWRVRRWLAGWLASHISEQCGPVGLLGKNHEQTTY